MPDAHQIEAAPVHPRLRPTVVGQRNRPPVDWTRPIADIRAEQDATRVAAFRTLLDPAPPLARQEDHTFTSLDGTSITARVYRPTNDRRLPAHVFFHGGAFCFGTIDQYDGYCSSLATAAGCVVVSIDYRLAPEHPFPVPVEDCYRGLRWTHENADVLDIDGDRISVGGNSAGGNLAAAAALVARDRGGPAVIFQCLDVPATDFTLSQPSMAETHGNGRDYYPTRRSFEQYRRFYLTGEEQRTDPYASPLLASDLRGLPPALIMTCELDALRDEGEAYGRRLREAGVPCTILRWVGYPHGTNMFGALTDEARHSLDIIAVTLRRAIRTWPAPPAQAPR
jgi:acetyl esterase